MGAAERTQLQGEALAFRISVDTQFTSSEEGALLRGAAEDQAWLSVTEIRRSDAQAEVIGWRTGASICNIQHANAERARAFLDKYGLPKLSTSGPALADAVWLIVDHASNDHDFQSYALMLMKPLLATKQVNANNFVILSDRVSLARDGHQIYGTQLARGAGGCLGPDGLIDSDTVDERRAALGLMPLAIATHETAAKYGREACVAKR